MMLSNEDYPVERIRGQIVDKQDNVVKMLKTCMKGRQKKIDFADKLSKLVVRINLDRPILQKEKMQIILFEKSPIKENDSNSDADPK